MTRKISSFILFLFLLACGSQPTANDSDLDTENPSIARGKEVYMKSCVACHQANGQGVEGAFPPLANSDFLLADKKRAIAIAANGMEGEITVNGVKYNAIMAPQSLSKKEVKDVVNYILNAWGNNGGEVTMQEVHDVLTGE
ncbi:c-type cytochrome [Crocinitomix algicola]|uniref:c-type cytochrome n=1 Tax=Crocinitomix algicola TaxID=1740263 RepID=UPI000872EB8E|nr:cytochrome c [Crocinitomix algicola]